MVMAACALQPLGQKHVSSRLSHIAKDFLPLAFDVSLVPLINPVPQIHGARQCVTVARIDFVTGKLFSDETIVRLVVIERSNDIVAILICLWATVIGVVAVRISIPDKVEPSPCLMFTISRVLQQSVDHRLMRICGIVGRKNGLLFRRKSSDREVNATSQLCRIRFG